MFDRCPSGQLVILPAQDCGYSGVTVLHEASDAPVRERHCVCRPTLTGEWNYVDPCIFREERKYTR